MSTVRPFLQYNPTDVCYTDLVHTFPWEHSFKTDKWSNVLKLPCLVGIRETAVRIFEAMEKHGSQCPTVTKEEGKILLTWSVHTRIFRVVLCSGEPIVYYRGHTYDLYELTPTTVQSEAEFFELIPILAHFINPPQVYHGKRDPKYP